jgi:hypothetical protein
MPAASGGEQRDVGGGEEMAVADEADTHIASVPGRKGVSRAANAQLVVGKKMEKNNGSIPRLGYAFIIVNCLGRPSPPAYAGSWQGVLPWPSTWPRRR